MEVVKTPIETVKINLCIKNSMNSITYKTKTSKILINTPHQLITTKM